MVYVGVRCALLWKIKIGLLCRFCRVRVSRYASRRGSPFFSHFLRYKDSKHSLHTQLYTPT